MVEPCFYILSIMCDYYCGPEDIGRSSCLNYNRIFVERRRASRQVSSQAIFDAGKVGCWFGQVFCTNTYTTQLIS
jgi:hypothetical protein